jgi:hypothetical protein
MMSTDLLLQQRVDECRRLATAARKGSDRAFWLGLVERWQAVESRTAQRSCVRQGPVADDLVADDLQKHSPGRGGETAGASPARTEQRSQPRGRLR